LNATIIADATTSPIDYAVIADVSVSVTIAVTGTTSASHIAATGPGYLAILSTGTSTNPLVQVTVISTSAPSATSASPVTA